MSAAYLLYLALFMLAGYSPVPLNPEAWAARAEPYYRHVTGYSLHGEPQIYWQFISAKGATLIHPGGCTNTILLQANDRGKPFAAWALALELAHSHQGAACWTYSVTRDGNQFYFTPRIPALVNLEQSAQLIALEVNAERCRAREPGACYEFWYGVYLLGSRALDKSRSSYIQLAYYQGVVDRLAPEIKGAANHSPLIMNDTWALLNYYPEKAK